jgi:hypothetical protein
MRTYNINNSEVERYISIKAAVKGMSVDEFATRLLEKAMKDEQYRSRRNASKWQEAKALKETVAALEAELIRRNTLQTIGAGREDEIDLD